MEQEANRSEEGDTELLDLFEILKAIFKEAWNALRDLLKDFVSDFFIAIINFGKAVADMIVRLPEAIWNSLRRIPDIIWDMLKGLPVLLATSIAFLPMALIAALIDILPAAIGDIFNKVFGVLKDLVSRFVSIAASLTLSLSASAFPLRVSLHGDASASLRIPGFAKGSNLTDLGPALLHQNEAVLPSKFNPSSGGFDIKAFMAPLIEAVGGVGGTGGSPIVITVDSTGRLRKIKTADEELEFDSNVVESLRRLERRRGIEVGVVR